jgi:hypothetical protein
MFNSALEIFPKNWEIINDHQIKKFHMHLRKSQKKKIHTQKNTKPNAKIDVKILSFWFFLMHVKHVIQK